MKSESFPRFLQVARLADGTRTTREIADALNIPTQQVDRSLHYARGKGIEVAVARRASNTHYRGAPSLTTLVARLADGTRTAEQIAAELSLDVSSVRTAARNARRNGLQIAFAGSEPANDRPDDLVAGLSPAVREWLTAQVPPGSTLGDLVRALIVDVYHDEIERRAAK